MDPRERADAILARARARGAFVVTPESAVSPMDATSTLQIPRAVVRAADERDEDAETTMVVPGSRIGGRRRHDEDDELPAITQEALTDVVTPQGPRQRPPRAEPRPERKLPKPVPPPDMVTRPIDYDPAPQPEPAPAPEPEPEEVDGLIPTVKQRPTTRSTLSQRLDG